MPKVKKEHLEWTEGKICEDGRPFPDRYYFYCPGCYELRKNMWPDQDEKWWKKCSMHVLNVRDIHTFNDNIDSPTFTPSLLVDHGDFGKCHSYVTDGKIQYLPDSMHSLSGQTIDLPEILD